MLASIIPNISRIFTGATRTITPIGTTAHGTGASIGRAGSTVISTGRIQNAGVKAGVGIGATGAGLGVLGLGTQQIIEPLSQVANPIDSLLGKGTGWLLIVGAVILLIVGLLFKR